MHSHRSYSLDSLKGGYIVDCIGDSYRVTKGDTRSLDYRSYAFSDAFSYAFFGGSDLGKPSKKEAF